MEEKMRTLKRREGGSIVVNNRDIPKIEKVLCIMREMKEIEKRIDEIYERMTNTTQHLSPLPRSGQPPAGMEIAFGKIDEWQEKSRNRMNEYMDVLEEAEEILNGIGNYKMRLMVMLKYMQNAPNREIKEALGMSEWEFRKAKECIENARDMKSIRWKDKYIVGDGGGWK